MPPASPARKKGGAESDSIPEAQMSRPRAAELRVHFL